MDIVNIYNKAIDDGFKVDYAWKNNPYTIDILNFNSIKSDLLVGESRAEKYLSTYYFIFEYGINGKIDYMTFQKP